MKRDYYNDIPIGKDNAVTRGELARKWNMSERYVRRTIAELRAQDNGDNYIIVSYSSGNGFYRTDDLEEIAAYKAETMNRARHTFIPLKKINRVLADYEADDQCVIGFNNIKAARIAAGFQAKDIIAEINKVDPTFNKVLMSNIENNKCLPTAQQLKIIADLLNTSPAELAGLEIAPYKHEKIKTI